MTPADVLEAAADALFVHGRATGASRQPDGSMCVGGAVSYVVGVPTAETDYVGWADNYFLRNQSSRALEAYIGEQVWKWNDTACARQDAVASGLPQFFRAPS